MKVEAFYDERTGTLTYVVFEPGKGDAVVIDPVLDYDPAASATSYESVNRVTRFLRKHELTPHYILETHAHADHLSGSQVLKRRFYTTQIAIGERITEVQRRFKSIFGLPEHFPTDGSQFDRLFTDREIVRAGDLEFEVINTPGHTPACVTYRFGDAIFTGDTLFMPDMGTGRCDFPAGSASDLYDSITERLYSLPDETRVFVGHDYQPGGRELAYQTTIGAEKAENTQLPAGRDKKTFVEFRERRDATLSAPKLLLQSVQVNVDAGSVPRFLRIPINVFRPDSAEEIQLGPVP
ncbi:MAG: MBL fold metallo-hydrolase [Proteobacteria bacterium]|nr:MBL fold metallo-hydrolase [Pseudomonadota bacterium]